MPFLSVALALTLASDPGRFAAREQDWRVGPVVYQVFVDRFAPPKDPQSKRALIRPPRVLKAWSDLPKAGQPVPNLGVYSHELEFWGGDFASLKGKLDYISGFGADVVYLNPIHKALTNHRYDAEDFSQIDPLYGTDSDFRGLVDDIHTHKMRIMLDGVFNHLGRQAPIFQSALKDPASKYRDWFFWDKSYANGYRAWAGVPNLPALKLENPAVQDYLWQGSGSIVQKYLKEGADGWRLDVGFEIGPNFLSSITNAAHGCKPDSAVVGEISGYPAGWFPAVDGVFDFFQMSLARDMVAGKISGGRVGLSLNHLVLDAGIDHLLKSWLLTDNHDTPRLATAVPDLADRKLLFGLQATLPGSPVFYYGSELGMTGGDDPQNRAPMQWDLAKDDNPNLAWTERLIRIRRAAPALRYGDFDALDSENLLAFVRTTEKVGQTQLVVVNPTSAPVSEVLPIRVGRIMSWGEMKDAITGERSRLVNGLANMTLPAKTIRIFQLQLGDSGGYSPYHRIP